MSRTILLLLALGALPAAAAEEMIRTIAVLAHIRIRAVFIGGFPLDAG